MRQLSPLECVECHKRLSYEDADWQAYIAGDPDSDDDEEIVIYCPGCARRRFDPFGT